MLIEINDKIISTQIFERQFVCDLNACKGACCIEGDGGAPVTEEEVQIIEENLEKIKPYMRPEGIAAVEANGVVYHDEEFEPATTLVNGKTNYRCVASVPVLQYSGAPSISARVTGKWSGVTTSSATTVTANASGLATFSSAYTIKRGTCTFTVSGVTLSGWTYDPTQNIETKDSLTY
jgi:hypothetical protein